MSISTSLSSLVQRSLVGVSADASVLEALAHARTQHIHHLAVERGGALVGVVCTCDLEAAAPGAPVNAVMTQPPVVLPGEASLSEAVRAMNERDVGSVILLAAGRPFGIVTRGDVLRAAPELEPLLIKRRCACCGLTRHLETTADGQILCIYCLEPGADGQRNHVGLDE